MSSYEAVNVANHEDGPPTQLQIQPPEKAQSYTITNDAKTHAGDGYIRDYIDVAAGELGETPLQVKEHVGRSPTLYKPPSLFSRLHARWVNGWAAEIMSCALSVTALTCLVLALRYFDGYIVTEMPLKISINTLVAILTAVIKSSLLLPVAEGLSQSKWLWFATARELIDFERFDQASRGPWGSLLLMLRLKTRCSFIIHLAALGAWITVLAIAIDPFSQQIIKPVVCHRRLYDAISSVPRANNLTGIAQYAGGGMPRVLEPNMAMDIYASLLKDPETIPVQCLTGNCTFTSDPYSGASYQTLGFESACIDITAAVKPATGEDSHPDEWDLPISGERKMRASVGTPILTASPYRNPDSLFNFATITLKADKGNSTTPGCAPPCWRPFAAECKVWPVIETIESRIELSELKERVLSSEPLAMYHDTERYPTDFVWIKISTKFLRNGTWVSCSASRTPTLANPVAVHNDTLWYDRYDQRAQLPGDVLWYTGECVWTIDRFSVSAIASTLSAMFNDRNATSYGGGSYIAYGDSWIRSLNHEMSANISTVEAYTSRLARALTVHTRLLSSTREGKLSSAEGSVIKTGTCIQIRWAWLVFPVILVALTIIFLVTIIWTTRESGQPARQHGVWKSSSLAILFGGLEEELRQGFEITETRSNMDTCANELKVSFKLRDDGWRFGQ